MTNDEAIIALEFLESGDLCGTFTKEGVLAIIKSRDLAIEALEKQIPKKPIPLEFNGEVIADRFCPRCKARVGKYYGYSNSMSFIPSCECGQRLDLSEYTGYKNRSDDND